MRNRPYTVFVALAACVLGLYSLVPPPLGAGAGPQENGMYAMTVGDVVSVGGTFSLLPRGRGTVQVTSARLTGVPAGMEVVGYHGVNAIESGRMGAVGDPREIPELRLHPVTDVRVRAGETELWYVLVVVRITKPGTWTSTGFEVTWRRGRRQGVAWYPYRIELTTEAR